MNFYLSIFEIKYLKINDRSAKFIADIPDELLYKRPELQIGNLQPLSAGENILRSAGCIEQVFGGITTRLWDDPFEWTLPEHLIEKKAVLEYLQEVEVARNKGFAFIGNDATLEKQIPSPVSLRTIFDILLSNISEAEHHQGRAFGVYESAAGRKLRYN